MRYLQYVPPGLVAILWLSGFFIRDGGVGVVNGIVVFAIVWWLVIFTTLPIGVRSQQEDGEVVEGSEPGAPITPMLKKKVWWTTVGTSCIWLVYYLITESGIVEQYLPRGGSW